MTATLLLVPLTLFFISLLTQQGPRVLPSSVLCSLLSFKQSKVLGEKVFSPRLMGNVLLTKFPEEHCTSPS